MNVTQSGNIMARSLCLSTKSEAKNKVKLSLYTSWRHKGDGSIALLHIISPRWNWLVHLHTLAAVPHRKCPLCSLCRLQNQSGCHESNHTSLVTQSLT